MLNMKKKTKIVHKTGCRCNGPLKFHWFWSNQNTHAADLDERVNG